MTFKSSISLSDTQADYARALVKSGQYSSFSAVMQQGLELLREKSSDTALEREALRRLLTARAVGDFVSADDMGAQIDALTGTRISDNNDQN